MKLPLNCIPSTSLAPPVSCLPLSIPAYTLGFATTDPTLSNHRSVYRIRAGSGLRSPTRSGGGTSMTCRRPRFLRYMHMGLIAMSSQCHRRYPACVGLGTRRYPACVGLGFRDPQNASRPRATTHIRSSTPRRTGLDCSLAASLEPHSLSEASQFSRPRRVQEDLWQEPWRHLGRRRRRRRRTAAEPLPQQGKRQHRSALHRK